jgi:hypothetical protein
MSERPGFVEVRKNLIHFPSLPVPLRVLTGLGIAQVLAGILVGLFKDARVAAVPVGMYQNQVVRIGWPFLLVGSVLLASGWTYLLSGALQARRWVAFGVLALATIALWQSVTAPGAVPFAPVATLLLWLYFLGRKTVWRRLTLRVDLPVLALLLAAMTLGVLVRALLQHDSGVLLQYALGISSQVLFLLVLLIPMLVIAGLDLTEISAEAGSWLIDQFLGLVPLRAGLAVMYVLAIAKIGLELHAGERVLSLFTICLPAACLLGAGVALLIYTLRTRKPDIEAPGFGLLLVLSYLLFVVFIIAIALIGKGDAGTATADVLNQLAVQTTWALAGLAAALVAVGSVLLARRHKHPVAGSTLFLLVYGVWVLLSVGNPLALLPLHGRSGDQVGPIISFPSLDIAVSMATIGGAVLLWRLHRLNRDSAGYIFAVLAGISLIEVVHGLYDKQLSPTDLVSLGQVLLLFALAAAGLVRTLRRATVALTRRLSALGLVTVALLMAATLLLIVGDLAHVLPATMQLPEAAVAIVMLAIGLCWDMLMSGERFTNKHSENFPRHGRLLLYIGYVSLAAACLLWTKTLQFTGESFFDEGTLPPYGIVVLGIPMLVYLWALAGHRLWNGNGTGA